MNAFSELFNAHTAINPSKAHIKKANKAYKLEQEKHSSNRNAQIIHLLACGTVSKIVKAPNGYNFHVDRKNGETNSQWANRTGKIASTLDNLNWEMGVRNTTFKGGRIILDVEQDTAPDQLFKNKEQQQQTAWQNTLDIF